MCGDKACEGLGAETYLQYVEHPNRVQRRQRAELRSRSRKLLRNVGYGITTNLEMTFLTPVVAEASWTLRVARVLLGTCPFKITTPR